MVIYRRNVISQLGNKYAALLKFHENYDTSCISKLCKMYSCILQVKILLLFLWSGGNPRFRCSLCAPWMKATELQCTVLYCTVLTAWNNTTLLRKPPVAQVVRTPCHYWTRRSISLFATACHWSLTCITFHRALHIPLIPQTISVISPT
jgi:hypothetical protein